MMGNSDERAPLLDDSDSSGDLKQQVQALTTELKTALDDKIKKLIRRSSLFCCCCCLSSSNTKKAVALQSQLNLLNIELYGPCDSNLTGEKLLSNLCILAKENPDFCDILTKILKRGKSGKYSPVKQALNQSETITAKQIKAYPIKNGYEDTYCNGELGHWRRLWSKYEPRDINQRSPVIRPPVVVPTGVTASQPVAAVDKNGEGAKPESGGSDKGGLQSSVDSVDGSSRSSSRDSAGGKPGSVIAIPGSPAVEPLIAGSAETVDQNSRPLSQDAINALNAVARGGINQEQLNEYQRYNPKDEKPTASEQTKIEYAMETIKHDTLQGNGMLCSAAETESNCCGFNVQSIRGDGNCLLLSLLTIIFKDIWGDEKKTNEFIYLLETAERSPKHKNLADFNALAEAIRNHGNKGILSRSVIKKFLKDRQLNKENEFESAKEFIESVATAATIDDALQIMSLNKNYPNALYIIMLLRQSGINWFDEHKNDADLDAISCLFTDCIDSDFSEMSQDIGDGDNEISFRILAGSLGANICVWHKNSGGRYVLHKVKGPGAISTKTFHVLRQGDGILGHFESLNTSTNRNKHNEIQQDLIIQCIMEKIKDEGIKSLNTETIVRHIKEAPDLEEDLKLVNKSICELLPTLQVLTLLANVHERRSEAAFRDIITFATEALTDALSNPSFEKADSAQAIADYAAARVIFLHININYDLADNITANDFIAEIQQIIRENNEMGNNANKTVEKILDYLKTKTDESALFKNFSFNDILDLTGLNQESPGLNELKDCFEGFFETEAIQPDCNEKLNKKTWTRALEHLNILNITGDTSDIAEQNYTSFIKNIEAEIGKFAERSDFTEEEKGKEATKNDGLYVEMQKVIVEHKSTTFESMHVDACGGGAAGHWSQFQFAGDQSPAPGSRAVPLKVSA